jgi:hypothetical protein
MNGGFGSAGDHPPSRTHAGLPLRCQASRGRGSRSGCSGGHETSLVRHGRFLGPGEGTPGPTNGCFDAVGRAHAKMGCERNEPAMRGGRGLGAARDMPCVTVYMVI